MIKAIMLGNKGKGMAIQFYTCTTCNGASVAKDYGAFNYCPYCGCQIEWEINNIDNEEVE
jgi:hypothetical protein